MSTMMMTTDNTSTPSMQPVVRTSPSDTASSGNTSSPAQSPSASPSVIPVMSMTGSNVPMVVNGKKAVNLEGHRYLDTETPPLPPAVRCDTPDVWFRVHQAKLKAEAEAREEERVKALKAKKAETKGDLSYKLGKFFSNAGAAVNKTVDEAAETHAVDVREANIKQAKARLMKYFPNEVGTENHFVFEFDCDGIHNNRIVKGHLLITRSALLFVGKGPKELLVLEAIPLHEIVTYSRGVSVPCYDKTMRYVLDIPNSYVRPDSVQIFTTKSMHFNFSHMSHSIKDFCDGHPDEDVYERFINYFDHAWRAVKQC